MAAAAERSDEAPSARSSSKKTKRGAKKRAAGRKKKPKARGRGKRVAEIPAVGITGPLDLGTDKLFVGTVPQVQAIQNY